MEAFTVFTLDTRYYALPYTVVDRIIRAVEITPLSKASPDLMGVINLHGRIVPVLNIRRRFGLPEQVVDLQNYIVICQNHKTMAAFVVDDMQGLIECSPIDLASIEQAVPENEYIEKIAKHPDKLILIINTDKFLTH